MAKNNQLADSRLFVEHVQSLLTRTSKFPGSQVIKSEKELILADCSNLPISYLQTAQSSLQILKLHKASNSEIYNRNSVEWKMMAI